MNALQRMVQIALLLLVTEKEIGRESFSTAGVMPSTYRLRISEESCFPKELSLKLLLVLLIELANHLVVNTTFFTKVILLLQ